jgi:hypothetical protein
MPYNVSRPITKSDTVNFPTNVKDGVCDAILVGGAGIVVVVYPDDKTDQITCVAGQILPVRAKRVNSTTTTATVMTALYEV